MKELYTSPELKVTCFAPVERLATEVMGSINFSDLLQAGGLSKPATASGDEFNVKL